MFMLILIIRPTGSNHRAVTNRHTDRHKYGGLGTHTHTYIYIYIYIYILIMVVCLSVHS